MLQKRFSNRFCPEFIMKKNTGIRVKKYPTVKTVFLRRKNQGKTDTLRLSTRWPKDAGILIEHKVAGGG